MQEKVAEGKFPTGKLPAKKKGKKIIIALISILVVLGLAVGICVNKTVSASKETNTVYREYSVKKGDITVGIEESGTVVVDTSDVTFPVNAAVDKILVTLGTTVNEGDPVAQLNVDDIADVTEEYESKISDAYMAYAEAEGEQKTAAADALQKYNESIALINTAPVDNELTKSELAYQIQTAKTSLSDLQTSFAKYQKLQETDDADQTKLDGLQDAMDAIQDTIDELNDTLTDYTDDMADLLDVSNSAASAYASAKAALVSAQKAYNNNTDSTKTLSLSQAVANAQSDLSDAASGVAAATDPDSINSRIESLNNKIEKATDKLETATEEYNDFKEYFDETYDLSGDELDDKVKSLQENITSAQYNVTKLEKSYNTDLATADQKLDNSLSEANQAKDIYDKTINQYEQAVAATKDAYDLLVNEYDDIKASMAADGILYAPCSGTVSSILYEGGTDYTADQTILSVADTKYIDLTFSVSEEDITSVAVGQEASVSLTAFEGKTFDATVDTISFEPARSSSSVTYTVTVKLKDESGLDVYEGMTGDVTVVKREAPDVLYVENQAITYADGKSTVLVKNADGSQSTVEVKTGFSDGRNVEILSGLSEGDTVLAESAVSAQ